MRLWGTAKAGEDESRAVIAKAARTSKDKADGTLNLRVEEPSRAAPAWVFWFYPTEHVQPGKLPVTLQRIPFLFQFITHSVPALASWPLSWRF